MPLFPSYDGTRLWFETVGDGPPLVCLAGGPGGDTRMLGDLGGLAAHRTLVRLDGRAAGRSHVPVDRSTCAFTEQARDIEALRERLGLHRLDLLAHSAGALPAQEYAARFGHARRLVLVTPAGRVAREPDQDEVAAIRAAGAPVAAVEDEGVLPPPWLRDAYYTAAVTGAAARPRLARLAAVTAPVLAIAGAADGNAGTAPARLIGACYPHARVVVMPGCGHFPWLDDPAGFTALVRDFLDH